MKKIAITGLIVLLAMAFLVPVSEAKNKKARGIWTGLGIGAGLATIFNGIEHGRWSPVITRDRGYSPPPPPPVYSSPGPAYPQYSYSQPAAFSWQGVRVVLSDRGGWWGYEASVRGIIIDAFRSWGAEVIMPTGYGNRNQGADALYGLEIQARNEGNRAVVELWLIERATGAVRLHGLGAAEFYYDGSDRWRSFQWAVNRALQNLR